MTLRWRFLGAIATQQGFKNAFLVTWPDGDQTQVIGGQDAIMSFLFKVKTLDHEVFEFEEGIQ